MNEKMIKLVLESPSGLEMFNSWMLFKWAMFGVGIVLLVFVLVVVIYLLKGLDL